MASTTTLNYTIRKLHDSSLESNSKSIPLKTTSSSSKYLIHKATVIQDSLRRQGTASCKTRSEVRGGGKKPWKQKGTGKARSGSSNSPLWKGGGVSFGPKPRIYNKKLNVKEKQLALRTALYKSSNKLIVVQDFLDTITKPSTKEMLHKLETLTAISKDNQTLLVVKNTNENLNLSVRNIKHLNLTSSDTLNLRELLRAKTIVMTEEALLNISNITNN